MNNLGESTSATSSVNNPDEIKEHLAEFCKWLEYQDLNFCRADKNELLFLLLQMKKQLSYSISKLNMPPTVEKQEFLCWICSGKISLEPLQDVWECLETHRHAQSSINTSNIKGNNLSNSNRKCECSSDLINETSLLEDPTLENAENEISSNCSVDNNGFKENNFHTDQYEESEVLGNSSSIDSTEENNLSLSPNKSRSWYPKSLVAGMDDNSCVVSEKNDTNTCNEVQLNCIQGVNTESLSSNLGGRSESTNFIFKFLSKYCKKAESLLYPNFYRKFDIDGDPILQRTGTERTVCLTCCCELLGQCSPGSIMSHTSGGKHLQKLNGNTNTRSIIQNYHDTFLRLDKEYQSHQIYFAPDNEIYLLKCVVCLKYVRCGDVQAHILSELHKKNVIQLGSENKMHSLFYFLKEHLETYGIKCESQVTSKSGENEIPKRNANIQQHNIAKSINDSDPINKLPGRFSKHLKYLKAMQYSVSCNICDKGNNIYNWNNIRLHLVQPSHLVLTNTQTLNYIYHCDVCDKRFHDEIAWILHFNDEYKRHKEVAQYKNEQLVEYECSTCKLVLFGDSESLQKHRESNPIRRRERNRAVTLSKETKEFFCSKAAIRENGKKLLDDAESTVARTDLVTKCCEDLENALKSKYNFCKAYPFGSRVSGLGCSQSDLDIFIDTGFMYNGFQNQDETNRTLIISNVLNLIKKRKEFTQIHSIPTARTPIIQLKHKSTDLDCDVSFVHGLSVENTKFLRYCFELQPVAQKLILLIKKWSHLCGLQENITTYALAMLVIFYLQKKNYLLPVQVLKELNKKNVTIVGWETIDYVTPKEVIRKHIHIFRGDIVQLLSGFFKFYSEFNYKLNVVCPLLGKEISKCSFSLDPKGGALPKEMSSYVRKINTESSPEYFRCLSHFCVQDPFDLSHNLTKACSSILLNKFVRYCILTHQTLVKLED